MGATIYISFYSPPNLPSIHRILYSLLGKETRRGQTTMERTAREDSEEVEATGWKPLDRDERIKLVGFIMWGFVALTLLFILGFELFRPVAA